MFRIKLEEIKLEGILTSDSSVSIHADIKAVFVPDQFIGNEEQQSMMEILEEKAVVFHGDFEITNDGYIQVNFPEMSSNLVMDFHNSFRIYLFYKNEKGFSSFEFLDSWKIGKSNHNTQGETQNHSSQKKSFKVSYQIESTTDRIRVTGPITKYLFKINSITNKYSSHAWIRFELTADNESSEEFYGGGLGHQFTNKQNKNLNKADEKISIEYRNELEVNVWFYWSSVFLNSKYTFSIKDQPQNLSGLNSTYGIFGELGETEIMIFEIEVKVTPQIYVTKTIRTEEHFSWDVTHISRSQRLNFAPFVNKMNRIKNKLSEIFDREADWYNFNFLVQSFKIEPENYIHLADPNYSSDAERIKDFITAYYDAMDEEQKERYIEKLAHSQYPIMAYPVYPEPTYYYLKELNERFILPSSDELPDNSMLMFVNNPAFVESFLAGMNTELGRELLWREYPTDSRGSYFQKFWDTEVRKDIKEEIRNDSFFDVLPLHQWKKELGKNHTEGKDDLLIFAIKGELLKKYPETTIFLGKAQLDGNEIVMNSAPDTQKILPELSAWLGKDIFIVGFPIKLGQVAGNPKTKDPGYFLTLMNRPGETRFADNNEGGNVLSADQQAAKLLVRPFMYGKHISQFLSGWKSL